MCPCACHSEGVGVRGQQGLNANKHPLHHPVSLTMSSVRSLISPHGVSYAYTVGFLVFSLNISSLLMFYAGDSLFKDVPQSLCHLRMLALS